MRRVQENSRDIEKWLKLIRADGVGPVAFAKMVEHFGSVDRVLGASVSELAKVDGLGEKTARRIASTREKFNAAKELSRAAKLGVWLLTSADERFPVVLKRIYDPPPVLYVQGELVREDNLTMAIVGSRRCSHYGREQSSRFAHVLASSGFTICSGMARGIDTAAHLGALAAEGRTIAVMGCGLASTFPPENVKLREQISEHGACISELPLDFDPQPKNFPPRNRIIAGLALGTIVIEAALRSGALITARAALEYNREVMAVPGKIDSPLSAGTHKLLKEGARLIDSVEDVMDAIGYIGKQLEPHVTKTATEAAETIEMPLFDKAELKLTSEEKCVYEILDKDPKHLEQIIAETNLQPGKASAALISLRLKALIKQLPASMFVRK
ncbi:MAG: DNA-processing protein DprA [Planctomycetota bacterium]